MMRPIFISLFFLAVLGCESAGTGTPVDIPTVHIACDSNKCKSASGTFDVYVNFAPYGCAVDQIGLSVADGSGTVICGASGCTGSVSSWFDNSSSITQIESRTYNVCGWIDLNSALAKDSLDAFSEETQLVTESAITLTDWGASNYSRLRIR